MDGVRDKVVEMLSRGYSQTVVAAAVGCQDAYISQLVSETTVRDAISAKRLAYLERHVDTDDSIDSLETKALEKLHKLIPFIMDPMKALRVFEVENRAGRKTVETVSPLDSKGVLVHINLPAIMAVQLTMSTDKQVVEVNGRSLATLPSNVLTKRLAEQRHAESDGESAKRLLASVGTGTPQFQVRNILSPLARSL